MPETPEPKPLHIEPGQSAIQCLLCGEALVGPSALNQTALALHVQERHLEDLLRLPPAYRDILSFSSYASIFSVVGVYMVFISLVEALTPLHVYNPLMTVAVGIGSLGAIVVGNFNFRRREAVRRLAMTKMFPTGFTVSTETVECSNPSHDHRGQR